MTTQMYLTLIIALVVGIVMALYFLKAGLDRPYDDFDRIGQISVGTIAATLLLVTAIATSYAYGAMPRLSDGTPICDASVHAPIESK